MAAYIDMDFVGKIETSHLLLDNTVSVNHKPLKRREYKRSKTLTSVDWKLLLAFNPPPGYRERSDFSNPSISGNDVSDEREDKVLGILRNILRDLECEIREDKQRLKEEKRLKREERRRRREETIDSEMSQYGNRRTFRTASPFPFSIPASSGSPRQAGTHHVADPFANNDLGLVGVKSLSRIEENPGLKLTRSGIGSDWSRHSHDSREDTETDYSTNQSGQDTISTTETLTDHETSCDVTEITSSFDSVNTTPVSPTGISRAKTSYVNDEVHNTMRNNYIRTMDVRRRRLMLRRQMKRFDVLPNQNHDAVLNGSREHSIEEADQPFSISTLVNTSRNQRDVVKENDRVQPSERPVESVNTLVCYAGGNTALDNDAALERYGTDLLTAHTEQNDKIRLRLKTGTEQSSYAPINATKPVPPKKPVRNKLAKNNSESSLEISPTFSLTQSELWERSEVNTRPARNTRPVFLIGPRTRGRRAVANEYNKRPETERSHSGTSGYSTDEYSCKTSDSEEEETGYDDVTVNNYQEQLNKYFMVLRNGEKMAVMLDDPQIAAQDIINRKSMSLTGSISMSDLAIPDHVGWIIHQSEQRKMWGVVVDMLFCIFESQENDKPEEIILLPGCNIRPLVYKTAMNGLHTRKPAKTITGIAKYQIVIDNASTRKKHLFGLESATDLDTWFKVLKRASTLDPESTNELASLSRCGSISSADDVGTTNDSSKSTPTGYTPTKDSMSRAQKLSSSSPLPSPRSESPVPGERCNSPSFNKQNGNQPSPRGLVRHDSRRHSIQDIKKHLRRESDQDTSKKQPVKAHHFVPKVSEEPIKAIPEKKLRSFGSFESLLKFKKKRKVKNSLSEDSDTGSVISTSSIEQEMTSQSVDISATSSKLKKSKRLSKSLELSDQKNGNVRLVRRASDIKDKVFPKRISKTKATLGDLKDVSIHGFLYHKYHLKWHKLWCVVCRGCFYGFKTQTPNESAQLTLILANCAVVYVTRKDKRDKHLYVFKLSQENKKSIYLCSSDYRELQQWLTVLQMESNSVLVNAEELCPFGDGENESVGSSSLSSPNGSIINMPMHQQSSNNPTDTGDSSRSRQKKKKQAPPKPPRHSSCPPSVSRDPVPSGTGSDSSTTDDHGRHGSLTAQSGTSMFGSQDDIPQHDKALVHVWQNDRGYLFNVIRSKLTAYRARKNSGGDIYNRDLNGHHNNDGLLVVQDASKRNGSRHVRRSRSFNASTEMSDAEITVPEAIGDASAGANLRKRHKPLVVKKIPAKDLEKNQSTAGYMEKKSMSSQWIRYWFVLHEGTLLCYLTMDDHLTVDVLNLHGYTVTSLVDQFKGKRFVLQLSHENFTSTYLSIDSREEMDHWSEHLQLAKDRPSSSYKDKAEEDGEPGACAGCEENRKDDVGERRKQVKQKLLEEMLRQKHELEKKQAERHKKQITRDSDVPDKFSSHGNEFMSEDKRTSDVTRLRQRRLSTQLKVDTIQKQIVKPNRNKKGLFGFGKAKKVDETKNMFLQDQLTELEDKLHKIDTDLNHVKLQDNVFESFDVNQNSKQMSLNMSGELSLDRINEQDGGINNKRPASVKSTMQKWTNKTFSKTSTKKKFSSTGNLVQNGNLSDYSPKQNGRVDHIDGNGNELLEFGMESDSDDVLSNSVTDLTRPTADLRLDLNPSYSVHNGMDISPTSSKYTRSNSRNSNMSSLSSPRREINPTVLAEIDAFEELTRQVLGARSKD